METPSCKIPGMFQGQEGDNQVRPLSPSEEAAVKEDLRLRKGNPGSEEDGLPSHPPPLPTTRRLCFGTFRQHHAGVLGVSLFSSVPQSCLTPCDSMDYITLGFPVHHQLLELAQTHVQDAIQPSYPLLSPSLPAFNLSQHQGLSNESVLPIRWPKYWSFSFNIYPSNEYSGLILFRIDWFDLLAVQGTLKSLLQHHSSKASILWRSLVVSLEVPKAK